MSEEEKEEPRNNFAWKAEPPISTGLNKRVVVVFLSGVLGALLFILVFSLNEPSYELRKEKTKQAGSPVPTEVISSLPKDYSNWVDPKPKAFSNKEIYGERSEKKLTDRERFLEQERFRRLKRAVEARESGLFFTAAEPESSKLHAVKRQETSSPAKKPDPSRLSSVVEQPRSKYELLAGTIIPGFLLTGLNSDLPGQIMGQVSRNVYDSASGKYLLIPQGTKVIGSYESQISYGQERVFVAWSRLVFPNGSSVELDAMPGVDGAGTAGLSDRVNNHYGKLLGGVLFGSVLGAGAQVANFGRRSEFSELAIEGAAKNINQAGQQLVSKNLNIQPTLEVRPGARFSVFVTRDVVLMPYEEK